jgi:hypothetical protein
MNRESFSARQEDTYRNILGGLAEDIRGDWSDGVSKRIKKMEEIIEILGLYWLSEIDEDECCQDGRWMRNEWSGPYGCELKICEMDKEILDRYIGWFQYPESIFEDYKDFYGSH